ncbi:hypothetical protein [Fastidiosibacter lacustris]|uniref:hypothetical protein n=1 Tax=Fastidiosibacter lacustris TaxID=2056695 RepID=UPI000E34E788|nr:hypothetical protein [Fastidiosibacter lacustris]
MVNETTKHDEDPTAQQTQNTDVPLTHIKERQALLIEEPDVSKLIKDKLYRSSGRGYTFIVLLAIGIALCGLGVGLFALYKQQSYNAVLQEFVSVEQMPTKIDDSVVKALQNKLNTQDMLMNKQQDALTVLQAQQTKQKSEIDNALKANDLNQVELAQKLSQLQQSYLLPTTELSKQIQLMRKQTLILNLAFAKQAWQVLGSTTQTLFFINQAKSILINIDQAGGWFPKLDAIATELQNSVSIEDNFIKISTLQALLLKLKSLPPIALDQTNKATAVVQSNAADESWSKAIDVLWQQVKSLIQVQKLTNDNSVLLAQNAHFKILANLYELLLELKIALLNNDAPLLQTIKETLDKNILSYFADDQTRQAALALIAQIKVTPAKINDEIDQLITSIQQNSVETTTPQMNFPQEPQGKLS